MRTKRNFLTGLLMMAFAFVSLAQTPIEYKILSDFGKLKTQVSQLEGLVNETAGIEGTDDKPAWSDDFKGLGRHISNSCMKNNPCVSIVNFEWNMDTQDTLEVKNNWTMDLVIDAEVWIVDDNKTVKISLTGSDDLGGSNGTLSFNNNYFHLRRTTGGVFDTANYDFPQKRGYIVVHHFISTLADTGTGPAN